VLSLAQLKVNRLATAGPCVWRRLSSVCKRARSLLVKGCPSPVISRTGALTALAIGLGAPGITPVGIIWSSGVTGIFILFFSFVKELHFGKVFYFFFFRVFLCSAEEIGTSQFFLSGDQNWLKWKLSSSPLFSTTGMLVYTLGWYSSPCPLSISNCFSMG